MQCVGLHKGHALVIPSQQKVSLFTAAMSWVAMQKLYATQIVHEATHRIPAVRRWEFNGHVECHKCMMCTASDPSFCSWALQIHDAGSTLPPQYCMSG